MRHRFLLGSIILLGMLAFAGARTLAEGPDQVAKDSSGREVSRTRIHADGSSQRVLTSYGEGLARRVSRNDLDVQGRVTLRVVEEYDATGRIAQREEVTVDKDGRESGKRLSYRYEADGTPRVTTETIKP
jgi:hypothetical protein